MTKSRESESEIDSYGGFADAAFGRGDSDGFVNGGEGAFLRETALHAGELRGAPERGRPWERGC